MRGYVVDVYFCVFDVSVEEFGVDLDLDLDLELELELDLELEIGLGIVLVDVGYLILPLPRVARTLVLELCLLLV
ncbi:hypothetical protein BSPWISOXPB_11090 [uncultured Gammaproteobacteria bacterium]|nr:hypothetical protein BSPWISOXPB_11090 [uncultured Gammaproteobacteria bacterium]